MLSSEYLAGFFDGEGNVSCYLQGRPPYEKIPVLFAIITNQDHRTLRKIREQFGGGVAQVSGHRPCWYWHCSGEKAHAFLLAVYPWLRVKANLA